MDLPVELWLDIVQRSAVGDLKALRHVCRTSSKVATTLLFRSIYVSDDPEIIEKAMNILSHFSGLIQTLILNLIGRKRLEKKHYKEYVMKTETYSSYITHPKSSNWPPPIPDSDEEEYLYHNPPTGRLPHRSRFREHIHMGWKEHYNVQAGPRSEERTLKHSLINLCDTAPNLRDLILVDRGWRHTIPMDNELAKYCRWADCSIPREAHAMFRLSTDVISAETLAVQLYTLVPINGWRRIALKQGGDTRRTLRVQVMDWFARSIVSPKVQESLIPNLKYLKLNLDDCFDHDFKHIAGVGILGRSLTNTNNLEHLEIRRVYPFRGTHKSPGTRTFLHLFYGSSFPSLHTLILRNYGIQGSVFCRFLSDTPPLTRVMLHTCSLISERWPDVLAHIKMNTQVKVFMLMKIEGPFSALSGCYTDYKGDVGRFLRGKGPNPLLREELGNHFTELGRSMAARMKRKRFIKRQKRKDRGFDGGFSAWRVLGPSSLERLLK